MEICQHGAASYLKCHIWTSERTIQVPPSHSGHSTSPVQLTTTCVDDDKKKKKNTVLSETYCSLWLDLDCEGLAEVSSKYIWVPWVCYWHCAALPPSGSQCPPYCNLILESMTSFCTRLKEDTPSVCKWKSTMWLKKAQTPHTHIIIQSHRHAHTHTHTQKGSHRSRHPNHMEFSLGKASHTHMLLPYHSEKHICNRGGQPYLYLKTTGSEEPENVWWAALACALQSRKGLHVEVQLEVALGSVKALGLQVTGLWS